MKIFNWVHRRFIPKDGLDQNLVLKDEEILSNNDHADTAALLEGVIVPAQDMVHEYHGWGAGAGILSIGTFGLKDNFGTNNERSKKYLGLMPKDEDMQLEDEDEYFQSHVENDDEADDDNSSDGKDCEEEWNPLVYDKSGAPSPHAIIINNINLDASKLLLQVQDYSISELDNNISMTNKKEKERITLADLFSADSDDGLDSTKKPKNYCKTTRGRPPSPLDREYCSKKTSSTSNLPTPDLPAKNGTQFPKKLIPRLKQDSRPIQKLNGFMKRMLKRKIHPDAAEGKIKPCVAGNGRVNESVSLLQSQGATSEL